MPQRIANRDAHSYVQRRQEFKGSNLWGQILEETGPENDNELYVVYSYGTHFPVCVHDMRLNRWFHNADGYSSSTERHKLRCGHPGEPKDTLELRRIIEAGGYFEMIDQRIVHAGDTPQLAGRLLDPIPA